MQRAVHLAERHAALRATAGLLGGTGFAVLGIDLAEIGTPLVGCPFFRQRLLDIDEA